MQMITPEPREEFLSGLTPQGFCGGYKSGSTHYEGLQGGRTLVGWRVTSPSVKGNCTIRIGNSPNEDKMILLRPLDGSADENGYFLCGRQETSFEGKEVRLPRDISCDSCILEIIWKTEKGK